MDTPHVEASHAPKAARFVCARSLLNATPNYSPAPDSHGGPSHGLAECKSVLYDSVLKTESIPMLVGTNFATPPSVQPRTCGQRSGPVRYGGSGWLAVTKGRDPSHNHTGLLEPAAQNPKWTLSHPCTNHCDTTHSRCLCQNALRLSPNLPPPPRALVEH